MKKLLSMILTLALCLGLAVPAVAAGKTVVNTAEELQAAFDKGGEVVLGSDIGSKETLTVTKSTRLDLARYRRPGSWAARAITSSALPRPIRGNSPSSRFPGCLMQ